MGLEELSVAQMAAPTRWGIASSGLISHDFANALSIYPEKHKVVAVAARSIDRAKEFANKFDIKNAHGRDGCLYIVSFLTHHDFSKKDSSSNFI